MIRRPPRSTRTDTLCPYTTLFRSLLTVPLLAVLGLALALVLNRPARWAAVLRTIFFASTVLSVTVVTLVWRLVFLPDSGLLSVLTRALGGTPIAFLNAEPLAMPAIARSDKRRVGTE